MKKLNSKENTNNSIQQEEFQLININNEQVLENVNKMFEEIFFCTSVKEMRMLVTDSI